MGFIDVNAPSDYEILDARTGDQARKHLRANAIIKRVYGYGGSPKGFAVLVPDAGDDATARELLKFYRDAEKQQREDRNVREQEFQDSLLSPHPFMRESRDNLQCYCGALEDVEIHKNPDPTE